MSKNILTLVWLYQSTPPTQILLKNIFLVTFFLSYATKYPTLCPRLIFISPSFSWTVGPWFRIVKKFQILHSHFFRNKKTWSNIVPSHFAYINEYTSQNKWILYYIPLSHLAKNKLKHKILNESSTKQRKLHHIVFIVTNHVCQVCMVSDWYAFDRF